MLHPILPHMPAIFVPVSDLKRSTKWYADLLERQIVYREHDDGIYVLDFDGTEVILDSNSWGNSPMIMFDTKEIAAAHQFCEGLHHETLTDVFSDEYISVFTINSNMISQTHRAEGWTKTKPAHALLKKISHILIHSDNMQESVSWYEKFVARSANPDSLFEELPCIRMDKGAFLLIDDNRLCQSPRVYYENLKLVIRVNPIVIIETEDLRASLDWVRSKGAAAVDGIQSRMGIRLFVFHDPDGNEFIVCESNLERNNNDEYKECN